MRVIRWITLAIKVLQTAIHLRRLWLEGQRLTKPKKEMIMKTDIVDKLNQEFTRVQVKNRRGPRGKRLDYIEAHAVIARLNEALEADWSFEIVEHHVIEKEVLVVGKLTVHSDPEVGKTAFGSQVIKRSQETGEVVCLGDDLKAAASDSLKKAATLLGVGLHLYNRDRQQPVAQANTRQQPAGGNGGHRTVGNPRDPWLHAKGSEKVDQRASGGECAQQPSGGNGSQQAGGGSITIREPDAPLSLKQMKAIFSIGKRCGLNNKTIKELVKDRFSKAAVDDLTKQEASDLISSLQQ